MSKVLTYENELVKVARDLPQERVKEVVDFAKYLVWQSLPQKTFAERADDLWLVMREQAEKSGFNLRDVSRLITKTRHKK